jgi:hypothetical protein
MNFMERGNYNKLLEPAGNIIVHGAGQDSIYSGTPEIRVESIIVL